MLLRSSAFAKCLKGGAPGLNRFEQQLLAYVNRRGFLTSTARPGLKCVNIILQTKNGAVGRLLPQVAYFSNADGGSPKQSPPEKDKIADQKMALAEIKSAVEKSSAASVEDKIADIKDTTKLIKQMELTVGGTKLKVDATAGADSMITDIVLRKEEVTPTPKMPEVVVKKRIRVDLTASSLERNFITPIRAMSDFLLKPSDLESLPKTKRRSPYELEPPITVYWRRDVEAKANEVWGNKENLKKEILRKEIEIRRYQQNVFTVKKRLRDYRREAGTTTPVVDNEAGLKGRSGRVVLTAVAINGCNFLFKLLAWAYTGSHSMFSECIHSMADTINQLILAYGIHKSGQIADSNHPYGYTNMRYVASLISGVGIFCVGTGLSYYHGFVGLMNPVPLESFYWAYFVLGGSIVSEGATLVVAINAIKKGAKEANMPFKDYVLRGSDPSVNVVLLEDTAAVAGVAVAGTFMGLSSMTGNMQWDACGSLFVGTILGCVASFIILTNVGALVGRSIPQDQLDRINNELETDVMVRAIHDVKGIDMGSNLVRYKAELDFDGRELTRMYLDKQDLTALFAEVTKLQTLDELEGFMLKHGENIVDMMGGEIDRIELKLRKRFPDLRHCDLEIL